MSTSVKAAQARMMGTSSRLYMACIEQPKDVPSFNGQLAIERSLSAYAHAVADIEMLIKSVEDDGLTSRFLSMIAERKAHISALEPAQDILPFHSVRPLEVAKVL